MATSLINSLENPTINIIQNNIVVTPEQCANLFLNSLNDIERNKFKKMIDMGAIVGGSVASAYNIDVSEFMEEVKKII